MDFLVETNQRLAKTQSWRKQALCASYPTMAPWFTADVVSNEKRAEMRAICTQCPVRIQCHESATSKPKATAGFWAGLSFNQWGGTQEPQDGPEAEND